MNESVEIQTAANGFIVTTGCPRRRDMDAFAGSTYVFETFESLAKWLDGNLRKPKAEESQKA